MKREIFFLGIFLLSLSPLRAELNWRGEYRIGGKVQANCEGEVYRPGSLESNNYGWWEQRVRIDSWYKITSHTSFISRVDIVSVLGNRSPLFAREEELEKKEDFPEEPTQIQIRRFYLLSSFPGWKFWGGTSLFTLGEGLVLGKEADGIGLTLKRRGWEGSLTYLRQYEGKIREYRKKLNDDEDIFIFLFKKEDKDSSLSFFLIHDAITEIKTVEAFRTQTPSLDYLFLNEEGGAYLNYGGVNWKKKNLSLEGIYQWGGFPGKSGKVSVNAWVFWLKVKRGLLPLDLTLGWGSGDRKDTSPYEGFFAPHNGFNRWREDEEEWISGYPHLYGRMAPSSGPSRGLENTFLINLSFGYPSEEKKYFLSLSWLRANEPLREIGWEVDGWMEFPLPEKKMKLLLTLARLFLTSSFFGKNLEGAAEFKIFLKITL